jgi:hypothetical protein
MPDTFADIGTKAPLVRRIALTAVLEKTGCTVDRFDTAKWHTPRGVISVSGEKFMNWTTGTGGGGAIDLVLHLTPLDFKTAVLWLADAFPGASLHPSCRPPCTSRHASCVPVRHDAALPRLRSYLMHDRCLPATLIESVIQSGRLYADEKANAVFLLLGKEKCIVGAELRGTTPRKWHGMSPGSRKDLGCFSATLSPSSRKVVLCESAIDALSCLALQQDCIAISTSGAHPSPAWLPLLLRKGFQVYCGFDADQTGDCLADRMRQLYPAVKRLRPGKHDWNDVLKSEGAVSVIPHSQEVP